MLMSETVAESKPEPAETDVPAPKKVSRRSMLMALGVGINAVAAALFAIPIVGYVLAPARRKEMSADLAWVSLGELAQFPEGETRLAAAMVSTIGTVHVPVPWRGLLC